MRAILARAALISAFFIVMMAPDFGCGGRAVSLPVPIPRPQSAPEPRDAATLTGVIRDDATNTIIEGAEVSVTQGEFLARDHTGFAGSYAFMSGLHEGEARVTVRAKGYHTDSLSTTLYAGYNKLDFAVVPAR